MNQTPATFIHYNLPRKFANHNCTPAMITWDSEILLTGMANEMRPLRENMKCEMRRILVGSASLKTRLAMCLVCAKCGLLTSFPLFYKSMGLYIQNTFT